MLETTAVEHGGNVTYTGETPTKEGYTFTGWKPKPENITEDTKCYAQYRINTYTVEFYNGGVLLETTTVEHGGSAAYTGEEPAKEGYTFISWEPEPENITEDTKCYAQYRINTYTVEFYNGDVLLETTTVEHGGSAAYTGEAPTKEGYTFTGWGPKPENITADTKCHAQFRINTYTVEFYDGDKLLQKVTVEHGGKATYTGKEPTKEGYTFTGWDPVPENITSDTKCYAQFRINTYTVEFYDGKELLQKVTVEHGGKATYTGKEPIKEGYTFTGWDPEPKGITANTKCYAQFEIMTFTVGFYDGNTILQTITGVPYGSDATFTGGEPIKEGYYFTGWKPEPVNIREDTRCYAQFAEKDKFAVYDKTDGSLVFYSDNSLPEVGSTYKNRTVSNVYTGIENTGNSASRIPWSSIAGEIKSIKFDDSFKSVQVKSTAYWFYNAVNCTNIDLTNFDTSSVTTMAYMFYRCSGLSKLDLSPLKTSKVTNVSYMFQSCSSLVTLDLSPLDTGSVENMEGMFQGCSGLSTLDLTPLNTGSVTNMSYLFRGCSSFVTLDLTPLKTSKVKNMSYMFQSCSSLVTLDLTPLDTGSVENMAGMFYSCNGLVTLDLTPLDTGSVKNMTGMFQSCSGFSTLDLTPLNTDLVIYMSYMFDGCSGLSTLDLTPLNTGSVTSMSYMFDGCSGLTMLDLTPLKTSKVTNMSHMFCKCSGLVTLDLTPLDTDSVLDMASMFQGCGGLSALDLTPLNTGSVTNMPHMFYGCSGLSTLDLTPLDTDSVKNMSNMFRDCSGLTTLDLTPLKTGKVTDMSYMFYNCASLTQLDLTPLDTGSVSKMSNKFQSCSKLKTIYSDDSRFVTDKVTSGGSVFTGCSRLVGGAGTVYNSSKLTYEMAHVDTEDNPGYFTAKE